MKTKISGVGTYVPEKAYLSEEIEKIAGYDRFHIKKGICRMLTGCQYRHYAEEEELCSDIAAKAANLAMADANVTPDQIDCLMFCSVSQEFAEPATANVVAEKCGIRNAFVFDIKNACNAFLSGVDIADSLIKTGKAVNVLVVSGEALSKWTKLDYENKEELLKRGPVALSIGDGGGAFVISPSKGEEGIIKTSFHTLPEFWNNNVIWGGGVAYPGDPTKMYVPGTTKGIIDCYVREEKDFYTSVVKESGWETSDLDCIVPTQVAKWILKNTSTTLGVDESKIVHIIEEVGNVGASNIPLAFQKAKEDGKIAPSKKILMIGLAVGVNIAAITYRE